MKVFFNNLVILKPPSFKILCIVVGRGMALLGNSSANLAPNSRIASLGLSYFAAHVLEQWHSVWVGQVQIQGRT